MNGASARHGDGAITLRAPVDQAERLALLGFERLAAQLARDGKAWPAVSAAATAVRGVLGCDRAGLASRFHTSEPVVDDLENGRIHPALTPMPYLEASPWLPWAEIVSQALETELPPVFAGDQHWPAGTAAAWLAERGAIHDPAPMRHPAAGRRSAPPRQRGGT
jgi:hypothetical protein